MVMRWRHALIPALLAVALLAATGCRDSEKPDVASGSTEVQLDTPDGRTSGFVYGATSTRGIVLIADDANTDAAQDALRRRAELNGAARYGSYLSDMESV